MGTSISRIPAHGKRAGFPKPFKETFRKIYIVERTNEAEIRLGEQSENRESCQENLWNEIQVKGPLERNRRKNRVKGVGKLGCVGD